MLTRNSLAVGADMNPMPRDKPPPLEARRSLKWKAVDLDGTLAEPVWTPDNPTSQIGDPIEAAVTKVIKLKADGWKIVIWTSRPWNDYEAIEHWMTWYRIPFDRIVCGKLLAESYIDDRAVRAEEDEW